MTLSSKHRIRNSSPGGLRPSTLPLGHGGSPQYWLPHVDGEETFFCFFQTAETGNRTPNSGVKGSGANHYPRAPAQLWKTWYVYRLCSSQPETPSGEIRQITHLALICIMYVIQCWVNVGPSSTTSTQHCIIQIQLCTIYYSGLIVTPLPCQREPTN